MVTKSYSIVFFSLLLSTTVFITPMQAINTAPSIPSRAVFLTAQIEEKQEELKRLKQRLPTQKSWINLMLRSGLNPALGLLTAFLGYANSDPNYIERMYVDDKLKTLETTRSLTLKTDLGYPVTYKKDGFYYSRSTSGYSREHHEVKREIQELVKPQVRMLQNVALAGGIIGGVLFLASSYTTLRDYYRKIAHIINNHFAQKRIIQLTKEIKELYKELESTHS
jgi:hypothetical protein